jgi:repressor of nif and glnA expression
MRIIDKTEKKKLAILEAVSRGDGQPMSSTRIMESLNLAGYDIRGRTIRLYLQRFDSEGLTVSLGKRGRIITAKGQQEIEGSRLLERVGSMSAKIDQMTFQMDFDLSRRSGTVAVNTTLIDPVVFLRHAEDFKRVFAKGYSMGDLLAVLKPGESIGNLTVPENRVGICTVCSITLNGVLLKHGVPVRSLFCGVMELCDYVPTRLIDIINYDGTSFDPLELIIRGGRTDYLGATATGNGKIGIGFRELPSNSRGFVVDIAAKLKRCGLGGFLRIGHPGQALYGIPVPEECVGAIVIGGLNPMSVFEERGVRLDSSALSGLLPYERLIHFEDLDVCIP